MAGSFREAADALISGGPFAGFSDADFAAFEKAKWSSNAYTLPRRQAKDKLLALARAAQDRVGGELAALELHGSDEAPTVANGRKVEAQWAYFLRDAETRTALKPLLATTDLQAWAVLFDIALMHQHLCLLLRLDFDGVALGLELAAKARVDRDNVAGKLKEGWAQEKLLKLLAELPEGTRGGPKSAPKDVRELDRDELSIWVSCLRGKEESLRVELRLDRNEAELRDPAFVERVSELLKCFLPLYSFLAWSRDNDHAQLKDTLKKTADERQKKAEQFKAGDRVTILSGWLAGQAATVLELDRKNNKAKVMIGAVTVAVELKDLKST